MLLEKMREKKRVRERKKTRPDTRPSVADGGAGADMQLSATKNAGGRRARNNHMKDTNGVTQEENIVGIGQTKANIPSSPGLMMSMEYGALNSFVAFSISYSVNLYVVISLSSEVI